MQVALVKICTFLLIFASVSCQENAEKSYFGWILSGLSHIKNFFFSVKRPITDKDVNFFLFSRGMGRSTNVGSTLSDFALTRGKLFFIIHGYMSGRNYSWYRDLTQHILERYPESLVAQVSWEKLAFKLYTTSTRYTEDIGVKIADIILTLEKHYLISSERFVLIGHSLGAQISGWAGRIYTRNTGKKLQRIIALDPAQPLFRGVSEQRRLNSNDAAVVFVVHTDGFLGFLNPCGTIDFFVNGGHSQKCCVNSTSWKERLFCDHTSAHKYFIKAISLPRAYVGRRCVKLSDCRNGVVLEGDYVSMGDLELKKTGLFHVDTPD